MRLTDLLWLIPVILVGAGLYIYMKRKEEKERAALRASFVSEEAPADEETEEQGAEELPFLSQALDFIEERHDEIDYIFMNREQIKIEGIVYHANKKSKRALYDKKAAPPLKPSEQVRMVEAVNDKMESFKDMRLERLDKNVYTLSSVPYDKLIKTGRKAK